MELVQNKLSGIQNMKLKNLLIKSVFTVSEAIKEWLFALNFFGRRPSNS